MRSLSRPLALLTLATVVVLPVQARPAASAGTTIAMAFTSPLTPGRPVVRLPLH